MNTDTASFGTKTIVICRVYGLYSPLDAIGAALAVISSGDGRATWSEWKGGVYGPRYGYLDGWSYRESDLDSVSVLKGAISSMESVCDLVFEIRTPEQSYIIEASVVDNVMTLLSSDVALMQKIAGVTKGDLSVNGGPFEMEDRLYDDEFCYASAVSRLDFLRDASVRFGIAVDMVISKLDAIQTLVERGEEIDFNDMVSCTYYFSKKDVDKVFEALRAEFAITTSDAGHSSMVGATGLVTRFTLNRMPELLTISPSPFCQWPEEFSGKATLFLACAEDEYDAPVNYNQYKRIVEIVSGVSDFFQQAEEMNSPLMNRLRLARGFKDMISVVPLRFLAIDHTLPDSAAEDDMNRNYSNYAKVVEIPRRGIIAYADRHRNQIDAFIAKEIAEDRRYDIHQKCKAGIEMPKAMRLDVIVYALTIYFKHGIKVAINRAIDGDVNRDRCRCDAIVKSRDNERDLICFDIELDFASSPETLQGKPDGKTFVCFNSLRGTVTCAPKVMSALESVEEFLRHTFAD